MSITITLLGHAPKKKGGYSSGGSTEGGGPIRFLHHAWCNDENGGDFTKTNISSDGHIVFYKFLGLCLSDDRDDDALSFNSYTWTYLGEGKAGTFDDGNDGDDGSDGSDGGNGNDGKDNCPCKYCCNFEYCGDPDDPNPWNPNNKDDDGSDDDPDHPINPDDPNNPDNPSRTVTAWYREVIEEKDCNVDNTLYGVTETGIEFIGNNASIAYADSEWNQMSYSQDVNHFLLSLPDLNVCPATIEIKIAKYMDFNQGPVYFADFTTSPAPNQNPATYNDKMLVSLSFLTQIDGIEDDSEDAKKVEVVDSTGITAFDLVSRSIHKYSPYDTENPPTLTCDANDCVVEATIKDYKWGTQTYPDAIAAFEDAVHAMFGSPKTATVKHVRGTELTRVGQWSTQQGNYGYAFGGVYDLTVQYRWIGSSLQEIESHLPTKFTVKYHDIEISYPVVTTVVDYCYENANMASAEYSLIRAQAADHNTSLGSVYDISSCAYSTYQTDRAVLRFLGNYDMTWLCGYDAFPSSSTPSGTGSQSQSSTEDGTGSSYPSKLYLNGTQISTKQYDSAKHLYCYPVQQDGITYLFYYYYDTTDQTEYFRWTRASGTHKYLVIDKTTGNITSIMRDYYADDQDDPDNGANGPSSIVIASGNDEYIYTKLWDSDNSKWYYDIQGTLFYYDPDNDRWDDLSKYGYYMTISGTTPTFTRKI